MAITHQDIADRLEVLGKEHSKAYEIEQQRIDAERGSLRELCGGVGHIWAPSPFGRVLAGRYCAICAAPEPATAAGA